MEGQALSGNCIATPDHSRRTAECKAWGVQDGSRTPDWRGAQPDLCPGAGGGWRDNRETRKQGWSRASGYPIAAVAAASFKRCTSDRAQRSHFYNGPGVRTGHRNGADVPGEMPIRIEGYLGLTIAGDRPFEVVVKTVDAERIPINKGRRRTRPIPGSERLIAPDFYQQPSPNSGTEASHAKQKAIVTRLFGLPQRAFLSDRRSERLALSGRFQPECFSFCREDVHCGSVLEEPDDAGIRRPDDMGGVLQHRTNIGGPPGRGSLMAAACHKGDNQQS